MLYEDDALIAVDKAPGVLTVPTARRERGALSEMLGRYLRREVFVVHRLDRDTSGVLLFAKSGRARDVLVDEWHARKVERRYDAIVHGVVARDAGEIAARLVTDPRSLDRRVAPLDRHAPADAGPRRRDRHARGDGRTRGQARGHDDDDDGGEDSLTRYRVLARLRGATHLEVELDTGRRNQIRVALASIGHPVLGDVRYARRAAPHPQWTARRLALHARTLVVVHPTTGAALALEAPLPAELRRFLAAASAPPPRR